MSVSEFDQLWNVALINGRLRFLEFLGHCWQTAPNGIRAPCMVNPSFGYLNQMAEETATTLSFELFPGRTLTLLPYHSVKNTQEVFQALMGSKLPGTGFLNPAYVCKSKFHCSFSS